MKLMLLFLILLFNVISRFWKFGFFPALINPLDYRLRLISVLVNLFIPFLVYFIVRKIYKQEKLSLLTLFIYGILPSSFVEGRIVSALFIPLKSVFSVPGIGAFIVNFFALNSFSMLFSDNLTFYWGGVRDFGVIYLSFLPFYIAGLYYAVRNKKLVPLMILLLISILISSSKEFPESRYLYYALPFISLIISFGILYLWNLPELHLKKIITVILFISIYEFMQFFHFYFNHYPKLVESSREKINYSF